VLCGAAAAAASDPAALFKEGNALARSGVYRTAIMRYREAVAAGLDTPLLHYNLGVAYYKIREYGEAGAQFTQAAQDQSLAALALYNRGLAERASGAAAAGNESFAAAAARAKDRDLRALAERAGTATAARPKAAEARVSRQEPDARVGDLEFSVATRVAQDDNVYRAPAAPYVDLSDPARPLVTPVVHAATFKPVDLHTLYRLHTEVPGTDFLFSYDLNAALYDAEFANANRVSQRAAVGSDVLLGESGSRRRSTTSALFIEDHRENNFDPDDGLDREVDGTDISDRFSYRGEGLEGAFLQRLGRWRWDVKMRIEHLNYQDNEAVRSYDHDYASAAVSVGYDFSDRMTLSFGVRGYRRWYYALLARNLDGALLSDNPEADYQYRGVGLGMKRRLTNHIDLSVDYLRLERTDAFEGYYDYTQDVLRLRTVFHAGPRATVSVAALTRTFDYPNAFAFNEPTAGPRELDETAGELHVEFRMKGNVSLWAEAYVTDVTSRCSAPPGGGRRGPDIPRLGREGPFLGRVRRAAPQTGGASVGTR
jgi:hypothetical protein